MKALSSSACVLVIFFLTSRQAWALDCYECMSSKEVVCGEQLAFGHTLEPVNCEEHLQGPQYCVKKTGLYDVCQGLSCYECSSSTSRYCPERLPPALHLPLNLTTPVDWYPVPQSCDRVFEARYCIKTTGSFGGMIGTKRFCSSRDFGNYCEWVMRPGDEREYRSCVYTCSMNACNTAASRLPNLLPALLAICAITAAILPATVFRI